MDIKRLHAHVNTTSVDCDGPIHRNYVTSPPVVDADIIVPDDVAFSDIDFMERVFLNLCSPYAVEQLTIEVDENGFRWHERTEEGFRAGGVRWCTDNCDRTQSSYRDIRAEEAGY